MKHLERLYFAYGANLNLSQIQERCIAPVMAGIARLPGYRLDFFGHSVAWDSGMDTIVPDPYSEVWGALYRLQLSDCEDLDTYMDARLDGAGLYFHYPVEVLDSSQPSAQAILYKKDSLGQATLPSKEYLDLLIDGAMAHGLPATYVEDLRHRQSKPAAYAVPRKPRFDYRSLMSEGCKECNDLMEKNR